MLKNIFHFLDEEYGERSVSVNLDGVESELNFIDHTAEEMSVRNALCFQSFCSRCLKITEKVSFNIPSEASNVYILSGQKLIKQCQKWSNLESFLKT